jgi:hypothetical protein
MAGHIETGSESLSDPAAFGPASLHIETAETLLDRG